MLEDSYLLSISDCLLKIQSIDYIISNSATLGLISVPMYWFPNRATYGIDNDKIVNLNTTFLRVHPTIVATLE